MRLAGASSSSTSSSPSSSSKARLSPPSIRPAAPHGRSSPRPPSTRRCAPSRPGVPRPAPHTAARAPPPHRARPAQPICRVRRSAAGQSRARGRAAGSRGVGLGTRRCRMCLGDGESSARLGSARTSQREQRSEGTVQSARTKDEELAWGRQLHGVVRDLEHLLRVVGWCERSERRARVGRQVVVVPRIVGLVRLDGGALPADVVDGGQLARRERVGRAAELLFDGWGRAKKCVWGQLPAA